MESMLDDRVCVRLADQVPRRQRGACTEYNDGDVRLKQLQETQANKGIHHSTATL